MQWPNIMLIIKDRGKQGTKDKHTHTYIAEMLNAPLSRDGISDVCGHMIREDFYYKIIPQPPSPPSVTYRGLHNNYINSGEAAYYTLQALIYKT